MITVLIRWTLVLGVAAAGTALAGQPCKAPDSATGFPAIALQEIAGGFDKPVHLTHAGDGSGLLYIVEQAGTIRRLDPRTAKEPEVFLDIRDSVESGGEKGLLSIAFHPQYESNGLFCVNYTRGGWLSLETVVSQFRRGEDGRADPESETILLTVRQPFGNHNGGLVKFGPDGYLYVGMGDGGAANDPGNNGQDPGTLLGALLRIDVDRHESKTAYGIPPDNPFVDRKGLRPEIWAYGLRNPWRYSFDAATGTLYLADVGQDRVEEIDVIRKGGNYGWNIMEGNICTPGVSRDCDATGLEAPIATYEHPTGFSVTGGYVYRGAEIPRLCGVYLYTDYVTGRVWGLRYDGERAVEQTQLMEVPYKISSFGQDEALELYALDHHAGKVLKVVPKP